MEPFIAAVRQYPYLWDVSCKEYRNIALKEAAWKAIVDDLKMNDLKDVKDAKAEWKKLRDSHRESLKRIKTISGQAPVNTWKYARVMEYLLPHMKIRKFARQSSDILEVVLDGDSNHSGMSEASRNDTKHFINTDMDLSVGGLFETRKIKVEGESRDAIDLFMESMAITIKSMPLWMQNRIKKKIFLIVSDAEEEVVNYGTSITPDSADNTLYVKRLKEEHYLSSL